MTTLDEARDRTDAAMEVSRVAMRNLAAANAAAQAALDQSKAALDEYERLYESEARND